MPRAPQTLSSPFAPALRYRTPVAISPIQCAAAGRYRGWRSRNCAAVPHHGRGSSQIPGLIRKSATTEGLTTAIPDLLSTFSQSEHPTALQLALSIALPKTSPSRLHVHRNFCRPALLKRRASRTTVNVPPLALALGLDPSCGTRTLGAVGSQRYHWASRRLSSIAMTT